VSSILDALEKLERSRPPTPDGSPPAPHPPRRRQTVTLVGTACAIGAAAALVLFLRPAGHAPVVPPPVAAPVVPPPVAAPAVPPPVATPVVPSPAAHEPVAAAGTQPAPSEPTARESPPAPPAPAVPAPTPAAPPPPVSDTGRPEQAAPAPPPAPVDGGGDRAALAAAPPVPPPAASDPRPWSQAATPPPPPAPAARVAGTPPPHPTPARTAALEPEPPPIRRAPAGAPHVQLSFLLFSPSAERRSVALALDGGSLQTLHEGESTGGLEVVRILPDRVDVRWQGEAFTVRARD